MKKLVKRIISKLELGENIEKEYLESLMILTARQFSIQRKSSQMNPAQCLADFEFKVFSQWGEDGIIDWLVERLPQIPQVFIEFGVQDYNESNTRYLLMNKNWRGLVIDGSRKNIQKIRTSNLYWRYDLTACQYFITRENINKIFKENGFLGEIGILSIDIDGNDYWVWESIDSINPAIVICEYSAVLGDVYPITIPYIPEFDRHRIHYSAQYAGASIPALTILAERKGYSLIGTTSTGVNAFFIRNDLFELIQKQILQIKTYPLRASDTRNEKGALTFIRRESRLKLIEAMPVINIETSKICRISELDGLYSASWQKYMMGQ